MRTNGEKNPGFQLILSFLFLFISSPGFAQEIITHNSVLHDSLSIGSVRAIFSMRKRNWDQDLPITVFVLADNNPVHKEFSKSFLKLFPYQLRKAWNRLVFSGTGQAPVEVSSPEEMVKRVSSTAGAIGYLGATHIDTSMVKRIEVQ